MAKFLLMTFETTQKTMKVHLKLKEEFHTEVIPAPKILKDTGCQIALCIPITDKKQQALGLIDSMGINIKRMEELDSIY